jgi:hypothetical protein
LTTQKLLTEKQFEILHDHYKETFTRIREAEQSRDRLFLWVIVLFALLSLEIGYPATVGPSLGKVSVLGGEINLQSLPLPALLHATWVFTLAIVLRYCQTAILVSRQYPYLHALEDAIAPEFGYKNIYRREGRVYLNEYPLLLDVAWFAYVVLFPLIVVVATVGLAYWELTDVTYRLFHRIFDGIIALALVVFFFLYRVQPYLTSRGKRQPAK